MSIMSTGFILYWCGCGVTALVSFLRYWFHRDVVLWEWMVVATFTTFFYPVVAVWKIFKLGDDTPES